MRSLTPKAKEEFTNGATVSPSESNTPNAILKLSTSCKQDMAVSERLLEANVIKCTMEHGIIALLM